VEGFGGTLIPIPCCTHDTQPPGEAVTFFTEDDVGGLRSVANIVRAAGGDVPEWILQLKKGARVGGNQRRAPAASGGKRKRSVRLCFCFGGEGRGWSGGGWSVECWGGVAATIELLSSSHVHCTSQSS